MRRCYLSLFVSQRTIPILPQSPVTSSIDQDITVSMLLLRPPVISPDTHPIEYEFSQLLDKEYSRYSRHKHSVPNYTSVTTGGKKAKQAMLTASAAITPIPPDSPVNATQFMALRDGTSIDNKGRINEEEIKGNFFNLDFYQTALKNTISRYKPELRMRNSDYIDVDELSNTTINNEDIILPPMNRITIDRALTQTMLLLPIHNQLNNHRIILPNTKRLSHESLRMSIDRLIDEYNLTDYTYVISNAPQAIATSNNTDFIFVTLLVNHANQEPDIAKSISNITSNYHWVTRNELLLDYNPLLFQSDVKDIIKDLVI